MIIEVWVCPTPGCGDYYGAAGAGDLSQSRNLVSDMKHTVKSDPFAHPEVVSTRATCQACRARGVDVERQRVVINLSNGGFTIAAPTEAARAITQ